MMKENLICNNGLWLAEVIGNLSDPLDVNGWSAPVKYSNSVDRNLLNLVQTTQLVAKEQLRQFAESPDFISKMEVAFGSSFDAQTALDLRAGWAKGDFSLFPSIDIVPSSIMNGANGAYAAATKTIYLSDTFLSHHIGDVGEVAKVLVEEVGHFWDQLLNTVDSAGDEGAIFSDLVWGETLSGQQLQSLKAEDDTATITLNGREIQVEMNSPQSAQDDLIVVRDPKIQKIEGFELHGRYGNNQMNGDWEIGLTDNTNEPPESQSNFVWSDGSTTPFTFTVTPDLQASFSLGGVSYNYGGAFDFDPNAVFIWAKAITSGSGAVIDSLVLNGKPVNASVTVNSGGDTFDEILITGENLTGGLTLTGNVSMSFDPDDAPLHSRLQFHIIPSVVSFDVNSTGDAPDLDPDDGIPWTGGVNSEGEPEVTLRAAIQYANAKVGRQTIRFDIPESDPGFANGVFTIEPSSLLPQVTEALDIEGESQPGFADTPVIVLEGSGTGLNSAVGDIKISTLGLRSFEKGISVTANSGSGLLINNEFLNFGTAIALNLSGTTEIGIRNNLFDETVSTLSKTGTTNKGGDGDGNGDGNGNGNGNGGGGGKAVEVDAEGEVKVDLQNNNIKGGAKIGADVKLADKTFLLSKNNTYGDLSIGVNVSGETENKIEFDKDDFTLVQKIGINAAAKLNGGSLKVFGAKFGGEIALKGVLETSDDAQIDIESVRSNTSLSAIQGEFSGQGKLNISDTISTGANSEAAWKLFLEGDFTTEFLRSLIEGSESDAIEYDAKVKAGANVKNTWKDLRISGNRGAGVVANVSAEAGAEVLWDMSKNLWRGNVKGAVDAKFDSGFGTKLDIKTQGEVATDNRGGNYLWQFSGEAKVTHEQTLSQISGGQSAVSILLVGDAGYNFTANKNEWRDQANFGVRLEARNRSSNFSIGVKATDNKLSDIGGNGIEYSAVAAFEFRNTIKDNIFINNSGAAIVFDEGSSDNIINNQIIGNGAGIVLADGSASLIANNIIQNNIGDGILVGEKSSATITDNTITNNGGAAVRINTNKPVNLSGNTISGNGEPIVGDSGNDIIIGGSGDDFIDGGAGNDTLTGGNGNDVLVGGSGGDSFVFNSPSEGIDAISDFEAGGIDLIQVLAAGFDAGLIAGDFLKDSQFVVGISAVNADNRFIYSNSTGDLFFDPDGTGSAARQQIAVLSNTPVLSANDIFVI